MALLERLTSNANIDYGKITEMIQNEVAQQIARLRSDNITPASEISLRSEIERKLAEFEVRMDKKRIQQSPVRKGRFLEETTLQNHFEQLSLDL